MNLIAKTTLIIATSIALLGSAQAGPMVHARELAEQAHEILKVEATIDKGGHRVAAMKHLKDAIAEINAGIEFDRDNVTKNESRRRNR